MEEEEEKKETAQKEYINLTLEIMEAKASHKKQTFDHAKKRVKEIVGSKIWRNISAQTKSCFATAEQAFYLLEKDSPDTDFSLVGMEMCKGLETEINNKLIKPFVENITGSEKNFLWVNTLGVKKGLPVYFTWLAKVVDTRNYPEIKGLSLGQFHFVLKKTLEDEFALRDYGDFLNRVAKFSGVIIGKDFLNKLKTVTRDYRNSITHNSHMRLDQCEHLRELIFSGKESLIKIFGVL